MDEPFGALDAQTRSILQKELQEIWQKTKTTIIFITHNIQESIILGNKILVMSRIPAQIKLFLDNNLDIPRMPETREFMDLWKKLYKNLDVKRF
jgi:NitT/TauT family transport system ATP-binding protein